MPKQKKPKNGINVNIGGDVSGQVVVGDNNKVVNTVSHSPVTPEELQELHQLILDLKNQIQAEAPEDKKDAALERANELEQAMLEEKPNLSTMEYVRNWFVKNLPGLTGTVAAIVVHPIVGKLVEAAGEALTDEFTKRFL